MYKEFKLVKNPSIIKAIEDLHANYIDRIVNYYRISDSDLNRFSWSEHKKVNIYMIKVFYDDDWKRDNYMTIAFAKKLTENNTKIVFNICLNYGGRQEIVRATKLIVEDIKAGKLDENELDTEKFKDYLYFNAIIMTCNNNFIKQFSNQFSIQFFDFF